MKNHFLFGAGASFGCGELVSTYGDSRIPPGRGLYAALSKQNLVHDKIKGDAAINEAFLDDFEKGMGLFCEKFLGPDNLVFQNFLNNLSLYLSSFSILDPASNLYSRFIDILHEKNIEATIATLNYNSLIEEAIERSGRYKINYWEDNPLSLLKLHGSVNFLPQVVVELLQHGVPYFANNIAGAGMMAGPVMAVCRGDVQKYCSCNVVHPSMALYERGKRVLSCPAAVEDIQKRWKEKIQKAENIFIVGMRVIEDDQHIWGPLSKVKANIYWYNKNDIEEFNAWKEKSGKVNAYHIDGWFDNFIETFINKLAI